MGYACSDFVADVMRAASDSGLHRNAVVAETSDEALQLDAADVCSALADRAALLAALRVLMDASPLPDDLRRVPDKRIAAYDAARVAIARAEGITP